MNTYLHDTGAGRVFFNRTQKSTHNGKKLIYLTKNQEFLFISVLLKSKNASHTVGNNACNTQRKQRTLIQIHIELLQINF